jgi:hypothetical protein
VILISYESDLTERLKKLAKQSARPLDIARTVIRGRSLGEVGLTLLVVAGLASVAMIATGVLSLPVTEQPDQTRPPTSLSLTPASSENVEGEFDALPSGWTSLSKPPEVRTSAAIAWTGRELFVWGGYVYEGFGDDVPQADGFAYDASADRWEELPSSPLDPRVSPAAAWTGQEMVVWGGDDDRGSFFMDGAAYNPSTGGWRLLPAAPISARSPLSVWSGSELIVWGTRGQAEDDSSDGAAYDPSANTWRQIAPSPVDFERATAVWTGREMMVLGGSPDEDSAIPPTAAGAAYDPGSDTWRPLPDSGLSPNAVTASWEGDRLIAWDYNHNAAAYDPVTDAWSSIPSAPLDDYECSPQLVPAGRYLFGDYCGAMVVFDPSDDTWHDVSRPRFEDWGFDIVSAGPAVLLTGRYVDTGQEQALAYRPDF